MPDVNGATFSLYCDAGIPSPILHIQNEALIGLEPMSKVTVLLVQPEFKTMLICPNSLNSPCLPHYIMKILVQFSVQKKN